MIQQDVADELADSLHVQCAMCGELGMRYEWGYITQGDEVSYYCPNCEGNTLLAEIPY